jgi:alpha-tubulin suppressor-like RCC1 family protein
MKDIRLRSALVLTAVAAVAACRDDTTAPTEVAPQALPAAVAAAGALPLYQVSGGESPYTCAVTPDSRAYCWGWNLFGQLGDGTTANHLKAVAVAGGHSFTQVSTGWYHTCAVTSDHRAYCWGSNQFGALGDGTTTDHPTPVAVAGGHPFRQVAVGTGFTCGVSYPDDRGYCWGDDAYGQLGNGSTSSSPILMPIAVVGGLTFTQVNAGDVHACGISTTTNRAYCWGWNANGRLGDSTTVNRPRPTRVAAGTRQFRQIDAGWAYTCAVTTSDRAFCWGYGQTGQLGIGKAIGVSYWPRAVAGGLSFRRVTTGRDHTCGETTASRAYCWGWNNRGQLGDGTTTTRVGPVSVAGGLLFAQVSAGWSHTCGKTSANVAYCWGDNAQGELGDGTSQNYRTKPTAVAGAM